jgi:hypothetical protein
LATKQAKITKVLSGEFETRPDIKFFVAFASVVMENIYCRRH